MADTKLFSGAEIVSKLQETAKTLLATLPPDAGELVVVPIMDGAAIVARQLVTFIEEEFGGCGPCLGGPSIMTLPMSIRRSNGTKLVRPEIAKFPYGRGDIEGKHVAIVDDLVDEGETLKLARKTIEDLGPASVYTVALVKKAAIDTPFLDHACFELGYTPEEARRHWLYGYGIDLDGKYRDLDYVAQRIVL